MPLFESLGARSLAAFPVLAVLAEPNCPPQPVSEVPEDPVAPSPLAMAEAEVTDAMGEHFTLAKRIEEELIEGRLAGARKAAVALEAVSPSSYPADWMLWVLQLRNAAGEAARAQDVASSSEALGNIVAACGACHEGLGKGPAFPPTNEPPLDAPAMQVHRWAAERMWEGTVGPSDTAWRAGTNRFPALPECGPEVGESTDRAAIQAAREQVAELTAVAASVTDTRARSALYGDYVATCAACHGSGC